MRRARRRRHFLRARERIARRCRLPRGVVKAARILKSVLLPCDFYSALPSGDLLLCAKHLFVAAELVGWAALNPARSARVTPIRRATRSWVVRMKESLEKTDFYTTRLG